MTLPCQRHKFQIPNNVTYLDCAYMGPLPTASLAAGEAGAAKKAQPWTIGAEEFFEQGETNRALFAQLIGSRAQDVALIPSVSYGMAVATNNLQPGENTEILLLERQFPSNVYPWRELARRTGARVRTISPMGSGGWTQAVLAAIDHQTSIIALPHVHWIDGGMLDLVAIGQKARVTGAALVLDLTQSLGALPFDVAQVDPDFLIVANYKWLLGPYTTGFLYAAKRRQSGAPLEQCWQSRKGAENFADLTRYTDALGPGATRYDMGERSHFDALPAIEASLRQILDWTPEAISATCGRHTDKLAAIGAKLGLHRASCGPAAAHYLSLQLPASAPGNLLARARAKGVYFSQRGDRLRITPHVWVNDDDIARFAQVLADIF